MKASLSSTPLKTPLLSIIIPTYNRPHLLPRSVQSALGQTFEDLEVIVVDDGSPQPVDLPDNRRLSVVKLPKNRGIAATRNAGLRAAKGRYVTFLDDDDQLLPTMAEVALAALKEAVLPQPVAVLMGIEVISPSGEVIQTRLPPVLPKGAHFFLEEIKPGESFLSKQTLVVERELLLSIGGYDEAFSSREHTELFLRLNPVCSLLGLPVIAYRLISHSGARLSRTPALRQVDFNRLITKHRALFESHPKQFAVFVYKHALTSMRLGQKESALKALIQAYRIHPLWISRLLTRDLYYRLSQYSKNLLKQLYQIAL
ncbi:MAG: glycosyltransferase [Phormidesmis sp.]